MKKGSVAGSLCPKSLSKTDRKRERETNITLSSSFWVVLKGATHKNSFEYFKCIHGLVLKVGAWGSSASLSRGVIGLLCEKIVYLFHYYYQIYYTLLTGVCVGGVLLRRWLKGGRCYSKAQMNGKTVIITGCNTGIGKETAKDLAKRGTNQTSRIAFIYLFLLPPIL